MKFVIVTYPNNFSPQDKEYSVLVGHTAPEFEIDYQKHCDICGSCLTRKGYTPDLNVYKNGSFSTTVPNPLYHNLVCKNPTTYWKLTSDTCERGHFELDELAFLFFSKQIDRLKNYEYSVFDLNFLPK